MKLSKAERQEQAVRSLMNAKKYLWKQEMNPANGQAMRLIECLVEDLTRVVR